MRLYVLPPSFSGEHYLTIRGNDSRYLIKVLRLKPGSKIIAKGPKGLLWQMTLKSSDKNSCSFIVAPLADIKNGNSTDELPEENENLPNLHLFQCLCKGKKNETILRMATEIGVDSITFVQSRFCISKKDNNSERYGAIIKEAIQQSGSLKDTKLNDVIPLMELPSFWNKKGTLLFFHQKSLKGQLSLSEVLQDYPIERPLALLIGSEGGLSDDECIHLLSNGGIPILLKTNILRAETAAIYALSSVQTLLQENNKTRKI
jgi:16S rRNA (uracil1498-N3)-methyltransferase